MQDSGHNSSEQLKVDGVSYRNPAHATLCYFYNSLLRNYLAEQLKSGIAESDCVMSSGLRVKNVVLGIQCFKSEI